MKKHKVTGPHCRATILPGDWVGVFSESQCLHCMLFPPLPFPYTFHQGLGQFWLLFRIAFTYASDCHLLLIYIYIYIYIYFEPCAQTALRLWHGHPVDGFTYVGLGVTEKPSGGVCVPMLNLTLFVQFVLWVLYISGSLALQPCQSKVQIWNQQACQSLCQEELAGSKADTMQQYTAYKTDEMFSALILYRGAIFRLKEWKGHAGTKHETILQEDRPLHCRIPLYSIQHVEFFGFYAIRSKLPTNVENHPEYSRLPPGGFLAWYILVYYI